MVRGLNKVQIIGNLGRDPEMRYTPSGSAVTNFTVAVNRPRRGQDGNFTDETEWFRVVLWDKMAETANEFLRKGGAVYIEGRLQSRKYTDKDGVEKTSVEIVGNEMILLSGREEGQGGGGQGMVREGGESRNRGGDSGASQDGGSRQERAPSGNRGGARPAPARQNDFDDSDLDDVPF
jgi:single-strand DNA-binding protein